MKNSEPAFVVGVVPSGDGSPTVVYLNAVPPSGTYALVPAFNKKTPTITTGLWACWYWMALSDTEQATGGECPFHEINDGKANADRGCGWVTVVRESE